MNPLDLPGLGDIYEQRTMDEEARLAHAERASEECFEEPEPPQRWQPWMGDEQP